MHMNIKAIKSECFCVWNCPIYPLYPTQAKNFLNQKWLIEKECLPVPNGSIFQFLLVITIKTTIR